MEKVPSKQEMAVALRVFAHYLGINVNTEQDLMLVAEEVFYDLPEGWEIGIGEDEHEGIPYFYNKKTHESGWTHPKEEMYFRKVKQARRDRESANLSRTRQTSKGITSLDEKDSKESLKLVDIEDVVDDNAPGCDVMRGSPCISSQPKARAGHKNRSNESKQAVSLFKTSDATAPLTHAARQTNSSASLPLWEDPYASVQAREAWQILHEEASTISASRSKIKQNLHDWGCSRAAYLEQLQPEEVNELAVWLKTLPARRFRTLLSPAGSNTTMQQGVTDHRAEILRYGWEKSGIMMNRPRYAENK